MKEFYDLHVHGRKNLEDTLPLLKRFNIQHVGLVNITHQELKKIKDDSLKLYSRVTLSANNINELKELIKKNVKRYDLIAVKSNDKSTFNWAIQDSRVDFLTFSNENNYSIYTYEAAKLCTKSEKPIELMIRPFLNYTGFKRSKFMRLLSKLIKTIQKAKAPFIISSQSNEKWSLRAPKDMISILNLVHLPREESIHGVTTYPEAMIKRNTLNRNKINEDFIIEDLKNG